MRVIDRMNVRYERLVALERLPAKSKTDNNARWHCRCDCGKSVVAYGQDLARGKVKSCGCLNADRIRSHGMSRLPVYQVWKQMLQRCDNPKAQAYENYGGRGITVCDSWRSFESFISDMGHPTPGKTLDRREVNGNYCKENCRWATTSQQANNKRKSRIIEYQGISLTIAEWADRLGVEWNMLRTRLDVLHWDVAKALTTPSTTAKRYAHAGQRKSLPEWAKQSGVPLDTLRARLHKLRWPIDRALTTPVDAHQKEPS